MYSSFLQCISCSALWLEKNSHKVDKKDNDTWENVYIVSGKSKEKRWSFTKIFADRTVITSPAGQTLGRNYERLVVSVTCLHEIADVFCCDYFHFPTNKNKIFRCVSPRVCICHGEMNIFEEAQ